MFRLPSGRYSCKIRSSGCGKHGNDVIDFLRDYEGMNFFEACEHLEIDPGSEYVRPEHSHEPLDAPPPEKWQERAMGVVHKAQQYLWSPLGEKARAFLHQRGFTDETIQGAHLGYIPLVEGRWYKDTAEMWGIPTEEGEDTGVWIPEGILIPWYIQDRIWRLNIRRLTGLREGDAKYISIAGGSEALYRADSIKPDGVAMLCESEFDALAGQQGYGNDEVVFVATGSTSRARRARWIARLSMAACVLVAFDNDPVKNGKRAGDVGAKHWTDILPQAIRWLPWCHDINDMLVQRMDMQKWVELGRGVHLAMHTPIVQEEEAIPACADCGTLITAEDRDFFYVPTSEDEATCYCSCCRNEAGQQAQCDVPMTYEQFMDIAQRIANSIPGGCTITVDPPGYTIQDRARELMQAHKEKASPDYWEWIEKRVLRPPIGFDGKPYYTPQEWAKRYMELLRKPPASHLVAHMGRYELDK